MKQVVLIGGGGHAKVIIEILEALGGFEVAGCVTGRTTETLVLNAPILGDDSCLAAVHASGVRHAFVAIGDNDLRKRLSSMVTGVGFELIRAVSPQAIISPRAQIGDGVAIMPGAVINSCTRIGGGCIVNTGAIVDHDCSIGNWVHLGPATTLAGKVSIGEGAFLGVGARAIPGVSVGAWATVGAGTVIIRNLPADVTAVGVPARIISSRERR